jgi:diaminopimelate epimerase
VSERLYKYHGLGNDFVVLDRRQLGQDISADTARLLCDRRRGVGADGVLVLLPSSEAMARMVVHNSDGSIAEMCGNGLRCAVKYLVDQDGRHPPRIAVDTGAGRLECDVSYGGTGAVEVDVSMGPARLVDGNLPVDAPFVDREVPGFPGVRGTAVSMGNPHLVLLDGPLDEASTLGPRLERSTLFPARANVEFVQFTPAGLHVVVWERGCGLTQACGTGACAAVAAGVRLGRLAPETWHRVQLPGGSLSIRVASDLSEVRLKGPVEFVFEAVVSLPPSH